MVTFTLNLHTLPAHGRRQWLVVVILLLGATDLEVPVRNLTFPYILCGMIVPALSEATLSHLETPNRVNVEFWRGVNGVWK